MKDRGQFLVRHRCVSSVVVDLIYDFLHLYNHIVGLGEFHVAVSRQTEHVVEPMSYSGKSRVDIDRDRNGAVEKLLGVEDVVYFLILQKSVCVDSRARYVEIASDERGARRYLVTDLMLKVFGDLRYDGQIHAAVVSAQRAVFHDHRFKRAVSGSLADPEQ